MTTKRKDFTPKKDEEIASKKRLHGSFIDLTSHDSDPDDDDCKIIQRPGSTKKCLSFILENFTVNAEPSASDEHANDLALNDNVDFDNRESNNSLLIEKKSEIQYYRNNKNLPLHGTKNPDIEEIFRICLLEDIPVENCVKEKLLRITHTFTFVIKQDLINLKHPYDLEDDDTPGVLQETRKSQVLRSKTNGRS